MELLVNPVRLRIVHALSGGNTRTTAQLCERLPDVSKATVYRHVGVLADAGVLEVDGEERVRGAVERRYRLRPEAARVDANPSVADHRVIFATAMATLMAEFNAYLDQPDADPQTDLVGYRQHAIWLNQAELEELIAAMRAAIAPRIAATATDGRRQYLLSPILFPAGGA
jgi:DNA-binding transcriptional ArsR family regulator